MNETLTEILVPIFLCVVLPVMVVFLSSRKKIKENEVKRDIIIASLEKNPNIDNEGLLKSFKSSQKLLKEKLLSRLLCGCICTFLGITGGLVILIASLSGKLTEDLSIPVCVMAAPCFAVGIAFLINFFIGKKMLASEIEAEKEQILAKND